MTYYRYSNSDSGISDRTGFGMFTIHEGSVAYGYGQNRFTYDGTNGVEIESMKERIMEIWEDYKDCAPEYMQDLTAEEFYQTFDPEDIVDDAGAWDNGDFRLFFNQFIYDDEPAILLSNGAIVFDESLIKKI